MLDTKIEGMCDSRFRRVRGALAENFAQHSEVGASAAITIEGSPVVDPCHPKRYD